jgi:ADP-ribose pyrophosphatase YjhB (NUDIX family)
MALTPALEARKGPPHRHAEPRFTQLAALCWRKGASRGASKGASEDAPEGASGREVLLVTSTSGRWILPKGWPIDGRSEAEAALVEAWEEGGVRRGKAARRPLGSYVAIKRTAAGDDVPCLHKVFAVKVQEEAASWPEAHRRGRRWVAPEVAAELVDEDGLRDILRRFAQA